MCSKLIRIESGQIGCSPSSTDNDNDVPTVAFCIDPFQSRNNRTFYSFSLHDCRKQSRMESKAKGVVLQLITKITITGCCSRRYNRDTLCKFRQFQFLIQCQDTLFIQTFQNFFPAKCHITQRVSRIYICYSQRISIKFMKIDTDLHQYLNTRNECLTGFPFEISFQLIIYITPDNPPCLCNQGIAFCILLHKLQITMAGIICPHIAKLRLYPISIRKTSTNTFAYQ